MNLRELVQGKEMTRKDDLIKQQQEKIVSLQQTIDLQMEAVEAAQEALNEALDENRKLEMKIKRMKHDQKSDDS